MSELVSAPRPIREAEVLQRAPRLVSLLVSCCEAEGAHAHATRERSTVDLAFGLRTDTHLTVTHTIEDLLAPRLRSWSRD
jgi:hypothetical protein